MEFELTKDMLDKNDTDLIEAYKGFNEYNTIRRNLREAFKLIDFIMQFHNDIEINGDEAFKKYEGLAFLYQASFYNAIILYSRWFGNTFNKSAKLNKNDYFIDELKGLKKTHDYIIKLRNKYIAHNELDILGGEKTYVNIDTENNYTVRSRWEDTFVPAKDEVLKIQECIVTVHNKIDKIIIPDKMNKLEKELKIKNISI